MAKNEVEIIVTAEDKASGVLSGIGGHLRTIGTVGLGAAAAGIGVLGAGFGVAMGAAIDMNSTLETSTLQFETLMGDSDRAAAHVQSLFDFAAKTPFETGPIIEASRRMQVFGGDALNTDENLTRIGDTAAAVGAPIEDIGFWVGRAYAAIQGGQPFGEAAQNLMQMGAVSPDVIARMNELKEAGASNDEIFGVLQEHFDSFGGAMEKQAGTWSGMMATLQDSLSMAAAEGLKPFFDLAKEGLGWLVNSGVIERTGDILGDFFELITIAAAPGGMEPIFEKLRQLPGWLQPVALVVAEITEVVSGFIRNLREGMSPIDSFIEAIWDIAPQPVLDALINFRDNILPGLMTAFHNIVDPIVTWVQNNVQLKDVLIGLGVAILSAVIPAVVGLVLSMAPILLTIGAVIAVVALLRNAWENNWGGIQEKVAAVWAFIQPLFQTIKEWLSVHVPAGLEALRAFWVDTAWPAIQGAIEFVWPIISSILDTLVNVIKTAVIPTVEDIYHFWVDTAWPAISAALETAWNDVIQPALEALRAFIIDTLLPAIQDFATLWTEEIWPAIKEALRAAWEDVIKPIWETLKTWLTETLPGAARSLKDAWDSSIGAIKGVVEGVKQAWDRFVSAVQSFFNWLNGKSFRIHIEWPEWNPPGKRSTTGTGTNGSFTSSVGGVTTTAAGRMAGAGASTVVNIDARGAARGVDRDIRRVVEDVMREYGVKADLRMRTA